MALDLGSTRIKGALLADDGRLEQPESVPAPPLTTRGLLCEGSALAYFDAANELVQSLHHRAGSRVALGVACQRSTFVLWQRSSGQPVTPMISWQDRRAQSWCADHAGMAERVYARTGLPLLPYYAGPKLAVLMGRDARLARNAANGAYAFGTMETYLLWRWSEGALHETDPSMAGRTSLYGPETGGWAPDLLQPFNVPPTLLPAVKPTCPRGSAVDPHRRVEATLADQAAAALSVLDPHSTAWLVNLGTGGFVLRHAGTRMERIPHYLSGPLMGHGEQTVFAVEGTMNGIAAALEGCGPVSGTLPERDPAPGAFCVPDTSGWGSPHWRAGRGLTLSAEARSAPATERGRIVVEGIAFRVREIMEGLGADARPGRVYLGGGLSRQPALVEALSACLRCPVEVLREPEAGLLAAARLAAGLDPWVRPRTRTVETVRGAYLPEKYVAWQAWVRRLLDERLPGEGGAGQHADPAQDEA